MMTQPRSIFRQDAWCHLSVSVYRPSSTNNQAVNHPVSKTYQDDLFWGLTFGTEVLHLIQINHQPDATILQFIILTFVYSSTRFGCFPAHHQELNDCSGSLGLYLRIVVIVMLCSWSGRPDHEHSTTVTTRLPLQSLSSWWWAGKRPKHVEL